MTNSDELTRATNGYQSAISLWRLASKQIYSRFSAMLTAQSIILAIIGLVMTGAKPLPTEIPLTLMFLGFILCWLWLFFVFLGIKTENHYRRQAVKLEKKCVPRGFKIAIPTPDKGFWNFSNISLLTIFVFMLLYVRLIMFIL